METQIYKHTGTCIHRHESPVSYNQMHIHIYTVHIKRHLQSCMHMHMLPFAL